MSYEEHIDAEIAFAEANTPEPVVTMSAYARQRAMLVEQIAELDGLYDEAQRIAIYAYDGQHHYLQIGKDFYKSTAYGYANALNTSWQSIKPFAIRNMRTAPDGEPGYEAWNYMLPEIAAFRASQLIADGFAVPEWLG